MKLLEGGPWDKERSHFGSNLHSDTDLGILFLLCVFIICKIVLLCYYSLGVSIIMVVVLLMNRLQHGVPVHRCKLKHIPWWRFEFNECFTTF